MTSYAESQGHVPTDWVNLLTHASRGCQESVNRSQDCLKYRMSGITASLDQDLDRSYGTIQSPLVKNCVQDIEACIQATEFEEALEMLECLIASVDGIIEDERDQEFDRLRGLREFEEERACSRKRTEYS